MIILKNKRYTEPVSAKLDRHTAKVIKDSKYNFRECCEIVANMVTDPVQKLKLEESRLVDEIEKITIREINPLTAELGRVRYKLKQYNIDVTVDESVLIIARNIKNLYKRQNIYDDLLDFIKSDKNLVAEVNRSHKPFDEFIDIVERLINDEKSKT